MRAWAMNCASLLDSGPSASRGISDVSWRYQPEYQLCSGRVRACVRGRTLAAGGGGRWNLGAICQAKNAWVKIQLLWFGRLGQWRSKEMQQQCTKRSLLPAMGPGSIRNARPSAWPGFERGCSGAFCAQGEALTVNISRIQNTQAPALATVRNQR